MSPSPTDVFDFDHYLGFGRYQAVVLVVYFIHMFCALNTMYFMATAALKPVIHCLQHHASNYTSIANNNTWHNINDSYIDYNTNFTTTVTYVDMKQACMAIHTGQCINYTLTAPVFESIAYEWNLICADLVKVYTPTTWQMLGVMVGAPVFGQLSDRFGRRKTLIVSWTGVGLSQIVSSFVSNHVWFSISRVVIGIFTGGQITTAYVLMCEFMCLKYRFVIMSLSGWALCTFPMVLLTWLCGGWRRYVFWQGVLCLPGILILIFFVDESPRWLMSKLRRSGVEQVLRAVAERNQRPIDMKKLQTDLDTGIDQVRKSAQSYGSRRRYSFWHLCYNWRLTKYSIALGLSWFTASAGSYSISFGIGNLANNVYLNWVIIGSMAYAAELMSFLSTRFIRRLGRKSLLTVQWTLVLAMYITYAVCTYLGSAQHRQLIRFSNIIAGAVLAPAWILIYLLSAELYPTPIRNIANGSMSFCARIGGALAPQIVFLSENYPQISTSLMTACVLGTLILTVTCFDETKGKPLPERMPPQNERFGCFGCLEGDDGDIVEAQEMIDVDGNTRQSDV